MNDKPTLDLDDVREAGLDDWRMVHDALHVRYTTPSYRAGLDLVARVGDAAEAANHHPDLDLRYGYLDVRLSSHDVGGVTRRDVDLARTISGLATAVGADAAPPAGPVDEAPS